MKLTLKEILQLPAGKQLLAVLIIAIGTLCSTLSGFVLNNIHLRNEAIAREKQITLEKFDIKRRADSIWQERLDKCEQDKINMSNETIADLKERMINKEKELNIAINNSIVALKNQSRTQFALKNISKHVKILSNDK